MIPFHGTPIGSYVRNVEVLRDRSFCISYPWGGDVHGAMTRSALLLIAIAAYVLFDCGAYTLWRQGIPYDFEAVCAWYRAALSARPCPEVWMSVLIPDVIDGGEKENDALIERFPADLAPYAWPVWHTEESIERLVRLAKEWGRVAIGAMGRHRHIKGAAYTARMIEVFNALPAVAQTHMLRGLQLAGGPFPFSSGDSVDAGRNWSQTPLRLRFCMDRWDRRAATTVRKWTHHATGDAPFDQVRQVTLLDFFARSEAA